MLSGKTFANSSSDSLTGTMINRGAWTASPTTSGKVTIPVGYHNGSGYVNTSGVYTTGYNAGKAASGVTKLGSYSTYTYNLFKYTITDEDDFIYNYAVCAIKISVGSGVTVNNFIVEIGSGTIYNSNQLSSINLSQYNYVALKKYVSDGYLYVQALAGLSSSYNTKNGLVAYCSDSRYRYVNLPITVYKIS